ncbi:MAG: cytochrome c oxidase subunit II [Candidatus Rokuibacteriota bacterium]
MLRRHAALPVLVLVVLVAGCGGPASILAPHGPGAARIAELTWLLFVVGAGIYAIVIAALLLAVGRRRGAEGDLEPPSAAVSERWPRLGVIAGGIVLPLVVLPLLFFASVRTLAGLVAPASPAVIVEVTAHQWWWDFRYRDPATGEVFATANELHVPVGERVELRLQAADVIHSFWVPVLQGKLDLIPGKTNVTWLQADRPGVYPGLCAEFCGIQHAAMRLLVIAQPPEQFAAWRRAQQQPGTPPIGAEAQRGQAVFLVRCAHCHTVRGTQAFFGPLGPDLTHVASRRTLAAGTLTNVKGNLAGWIADPQTLKPGNRMPRIPLTSEEFHAVLAYVEGLR